MQRLIFQPADVTQIRAQAIRVLPGHGTGGQDQAINESINDDETSLLKLVFSVLGNVIGGVLLLAGMFILPHILARLLG